MGVFYRKPTRMNDDFIGVAWVGYSHRWPKKKANICQRNVANAVGP